MNVLLIHEHGRAYGSGGLIAMYRLHRALRDEGVNSTIACRRRGLDSSDIVELPKSDQIEGWLGSLTWRLGLNDIHCVSSFKITRFEPFAKADVVNCHGLHSNFFSYMALPRMSRAKPVAITLHDMWHLTGHCAQSAGCERWRTGCGRCPDLNAFPPVGRDGTALDWRLKNWTYDRSDLEVVSPSHWLASLSAQSMLRRFPIHHIPNGVDVNVFRPMEKSAARVRINAPTSHDKVMIMFASASLSAPMKGGWLLTEALNGLPRALKDRAMLLLIGDNGREIRQATGMDAVDLGYVQDDETKVAAYSAADLFVLPSRAENHSLVLIEALACGTPCVAFDVGGNPEIVRDNETGFIARRDDPDDLGNGIARLLGSESLRQRLGRKCREVAEAEFSLKLHTQRYIQLYETMLRKRHRPLRTAV